MGSFLKLTKAPARPVVPVCPGTSPGTCTAPGRFPAPCHCFPSSLTWGQGTMHVNPQLQTPMVSLSCIVAEFMGVDGTCPVQPHQRQNRTQGQADTEGLQRHPYSWQPPGSLWVGGQAQWSQAPRSHGYSCVATLRRKAHTKLHPERLGLATPATLSDAHTHQGLSMRTNPHTPSLHLKPHTCVHTYTHTHHTTSNTHQVCTHAHTLTHTLSHTCTCLHRPTPAFPPPTSLAPNHGACPNRTPQR